MQFETKRQGNILILTLLEDLTFQKNEEFGALIHDIVRDSHADIVVDMTAVSRIDSIVAGHFVAAKRECDLKRRHFGLANVPDGVQHILHSGMGTHQLHVYDSVPEAIADLSDRSHGTQKRRLVLDIKCGNNDCVYYTYGKQPGFVVPACEYPYQDDITNGPTCKCYKPDWQQIQESLPMTGPSPFRTAKKKSLYEVRDKAAQSMTDGTETLIGIPSGFESEERANAAASGEASESSGAARLNHPDLVPKIATAVDRNRSSVDSSTEWETIEEPFMADDPFAVDNFPSSKTPPQPASTPKMPDPVHREPPRAPEPPPVQAPPAPKPPADTPDQVVKNYVHAWNEGNFLKEYQCLASRNRAFSEADYVSRRQALRSSQGQRHGGKATLQEVARVDSCAIDGIHATVEITRVDRTPSGTVCYGQHYHLILEDGIWRIQKSEDGEMRKNPTKPQKGRVMKAGDFLGKSK